MDHLNHLDIGLDESVGVFEFLGYASSDGSFINFDIL